jgi:hypothetical protein
VPKGRVPVPLAPRRTWIRTVDAEWRWRRAVRLLLNMGMSAGVPDVAMENHDDDACSGVGPRFDRAAGRPADH